MSFYDEIAPYYDAIFPLNRAQIGFVENCVETPYAGKRILDVGCGTGDLALSLAEAGFNVTGIDSDMEMIRRADGQKRTVNCPATRWVYSATFPLSCCTLYCSLNWVWGVNR